MYENRQLGLAYLSPYIIWLIVFTAFPLISSFEMGFTDYDMMTSPEFFGTEKYRYMLTEDDIFGNQ